MKSLNTHLINEFYQQNSNEVYEMSNLSGRSTGLGKIWLWVGKPPASHHYRVKVSNLPDQAGTMSKHDSFTITIPDYQVIGSVNTKLITPKMLNKILKFIQLNEQLIIDLSDHQIDSVEFSRSFKSI